MHEQITVMAGFIYSSSLRREGFVEFRTLRPTNFVSRRINNIPLSPFETKGE
jgi:hypothetical protein